MPPPSSDDHAPLLSGLAAVPVSPSVSTDELVGPLSALSVYLSVADRGLQAPKIDRETLGAALLGAREQVAALARSIAAACESPR